MIFAIKNGNFANFILLDLDQSFQVNIRKHFLGTVRARAKVQTITFTELDICRRRLHCACCTPSSWSQLSRSTFLNVNILAMTSDSLLVRAMTCSDFDIRHEMAPLRMFTCSRSDIFLLCICNRNCAMTMDVLGRFASSRTRPPPWSWSYFIKRV